MNKIEDIVKVLSNIQRDIYIMGHLNPDYDSIGSSVALYLGLKKLNKKVHLLLDNNGINLLNNCDKAYIVPMVENSVTCNNYTAILVDASSLDRAGAFKQEYDNATQKINIDHHEKNSINADIKYVAPEISANCENIFLILKKLNALDKEIAEFLYMGIVTDTKNFCIDLDDIVFDVANQLKSFGIDTLKIVYGLHLKTSIKDILLQSKIMSTMTKENICFIVMDMNNEEYKDLNHNYISSKIANPATNFEGVDTIALFQKFSDKMVVEFRSKNPLMPVDEIAKILGGGGHKMASGCTINNTDVEHAKKIINDYFRKDKDYGV